MRTTLEPNEFHNHDPSERGGVILAVLTILMPLVLIMSAMLTTMTARTTRLDRDVTDERALLAAESGVDQAIFESRRGNLFHGVDVRGTVGNVSFVVTPTYLGNDLADNDDDGLTDEPDEDVFQVVSVGTCNGVTRRIASYIGKSSFMPVLSAAMHAANPLMTITLGGTPWIDGRNHDLNGALVGWGDTYGIGALAPATTADVLAQLSAGEGARVNGLGGPPSVGPAAPVDLVSLVNNARNAATFSLTSNRYTRLDPGPAIYYRDGDLALAGNIEGSGLLVVTGNLRISGRVSFKGVIVVLGDMDNSAGTMEILGGLLLSTTSSGFTMRGTADIRYSTAAIDLANRAAGKYVAFNGWQELSRR